MGIYYIRGIKSTVFVSIASAHQLCHLGRLKDGLSQLAHHKLWLQTVITSWNCTTNMFLIGTFVAAMDGFNHCMFIALSLFNAIIWIKIRLKKGNLLHIPRSCLNWMVLPLGVGMSHCPPVKCWTLYPPLSSFGIDNRLAIARLVDSIFYIVSETLMLYLCCSISTVLLKSNSCHAHSLKMFCHDHAVIYGTTVKVKLILVACDTCNLWPILMNPIPSTVEVLL